MELVLNRPDIFSAENWPMVHAFHRALDQLEKQGNPRGDRPRRRTIIFLGESIGWGRARRMVLTGELIGAAEAERIGLLDWVVPQGQLDEKVRGVVATG